MKKFSALIASIAIFTSFSVSAAEDRSGISYMSSAYRKPLRIDDLHSPGNQVTRRASTARNTPISGARGHIRRTRTAGGSLTARSRAKGYFERNRATFESRKQRGASHLERRRMRSQQ